MNKSDSELIEEALSGSLRAFDELMMRYQKLAYSIALQYVGRENALDITQNAFLKLYENLGSLRTNEKFKSWLSRITYHESINWLRKQHRHENQADVMDASIVLASASNQEGELLGKESRGLLLRGLAALNPKHRLVVFLRYFEEMSIREIAAVLKCSEGLVKNILFRGVQRLRLNIDQNRARYFNERVQKIRTTG